MYLAIHNKIRKQSTIRNLANYTIYCLEIFPRVEIIHVQDFYQWPRYHKDSKRKIQTTLQIIIEFVRSYKTLARLPFQTNPQILQNTT